MKSSIIAPAAVVTTALVSGFSVSPLGKDLNPVQKPSGLEAHDTHAAASLLGQFRTNASSWMFLRADLYLHNGVEMRPLTDAEVKSGKRGVGNGEAGKPQLHDDNAIVTVVPEKSRDFRGWVGDVERAISSYKDMRGHTHNNPRSTLPLFRLMTYLDPQFVPGWTTGATILMWEGNKEGFIKAREYLREGLSHNPKSIDLLTALAYTHIKRDATNSPREIGQAMPLLMQALEIGLNNFKTLSDAERVALNDTFRWATSCANEIGDQASRRKFASAGSQLYPDDKVLARHLAETKRIMP